MGDINIHIKDGSIVSVDSEGGDDSDFGEFSGSGDKDNDVFSTTPDLPVYTTTSTSGHSNSKNNNNNTQNSSASPETDLLPYIIAAVAIVVALILVITLVICLRRRRRAKSKKSTSGTVAYSPNDRGGPSGQGACGEGYSVAIPLNMAEPPAEFAPPPPVPSSAPPHLAASGSSKSRYTPLGGRKGVEATAPLQDEKNSIYDSIDEVEAEPDNEYEVAKPLQPPGRQRIFSSVTEDPNMGSETDKMLPAKA